MRFCSSFLTYSESYSIERQRVLSAQQAEDLGPALDAAAQSAVEAAAYAGLASDAAAGLSGCTAEGLRLDGCVSAITALRTVWEVGRAAFLPELAGFALTDTAALQEVRAASTVL